MTAVTKTGPNDASGGVVWAGGEFLNLFFIFIETD